METDTQNLEDALNGALLPSQLFFGLLEFMDNSEVGGKGEEVVMYLRAFGDMAFEKTEKNISEIINFIKGNLGEISLKRLTESGRNPENDTYFLEGQLTGCELVPVEKALKI